MTAPDVAALTDEQCDAIWSTAAALLNARETMTHTLIRTAYAAGRASLPVPKADAYFAQADRDKPADHPANAGPPDVAEARVAELEKQLARTEEERGFHWARANKMTTKKREAEARVAELERNEAAAFTMLEMLGVPKERARSVHNGIDVLSTRWRKADSAAEARIAELEQKK